jgi:trehalose 2-sulfotransferase
MLTRSGSRRLRGDDHISQGELQNWMDTRLDFPVSSPFRKSYVVASSYRSGSTYFCSLLWKTGVLGAPAEYVNMGDGRRLREVMARRLQPTSPEDYFKKLLACRTSSNGVFAMKAHYPHFQQALAWCPSMLDLLSPVTYIYLTRRDHIGQAVSMAKAMQTNRWTSMDRETRTVLRYDKYLIRRCLEDIHQQKIGWLRWFELNNVTPLVLSYEDFVANTSETIEKVMRFLNVSEEGSCENYPPPVKKLGNRVNVEWAARFQREVSSASSWEVSPSASRKWLLEIEGQGDE